MNAERTRESAHRPNHATACDCSRSAFLMHADATRGMRLAGVDKIAGRRRRDAGSSDAEADLGPIKDQRDYQVFLVIEMPPQLA